MTTFKQLGLSQEILRMLTELGFEQPTAIQEQSIPTLLNEGNDFIGLAQTGTGKTAAFGLPLLEHVDPHTSATQALVLAPTRELGRQIAEQLATFSKYLDKVNVLPVYGGAAIYNQIKALRNTQHIIIATPGRLIDLIKRKAVKLDQLRILVLDEADEMLNMGFKEELDEILSFTPSDKQTWLFSATMPPPIKKIVSQYMDAPKEVRINAQQKVNTNIEHQFTIVRQADKTEALTRFLDISPDMRGVVFCRTKRDTQFLAERLLKKGYKADALHGDLSQHQRDRVMSRFRNHDLQVLVATDVAARGIDVNDLTHVFHFSLPDDMAYYTHRSGRTARAGKKGISISFISHREFYKIRTLERQLKIAFKKIYIPSTQDIAEVRITNWCQNLLKQKTKGRIDPQLLDRAHRILEKLSREAIINKLIAAELEQLDLGSNKELNDMERPKREERQGRRGAPRTKSKYKPTQSWNFAKKKKTTKSKKKKKGKKKRY
ncbi:MAG: DEAD/DEAH box helicase [Bacteroidota bacterium]